MDYEKQRHQKDFKKWFTLIAACIMIAGGMVILTACGGTSQNAEEETKAQEQTQTVSEDVWKNAYREVLSENEMSIRNYENSTYEEDTKKATALCDLNHNGVPELLFVAWADDNVRAALNIYTCGENGAEEVNYICTHARQYEGDEPEEPFYDVYAAGGTEYIIYTEKDSNQFAIYSTITDETIFTQLNRYEMDDTGAVKELDAAGYTFSYVVYDGDTYVETRDKVDYDDAEYFQSGTTSDKSTWMEAFETSRDAMDQVIIFKGSGRGDDSAIWEKAEELGSIAKSYDEMMSALQTEPADNAETDQPDQQGATYGETMEQLLDAYAEGDIESAEEYNAKLPEKAVEINVSPEAKAAYDAVRDQLESEGQLPDYSLEFFCDVDNDGSAEYLVQTGTCEADYMLQCYCFENGEAQWIGETNAGHSTFHQYPNHSGLIQEYGQMGYEGINVITFSGGEAQTREIGGRGELGEGEEYLQLGCLLGD